MEKEALEKKIDAWMTASKDENFNTYLEHVKKELERPDVDLACLEENLDRNLKLYWKNQEMQKKSQGTAEFKIGAGVLSVVGGVFILIALVILGREFLSDFLQGMGLYICVLVLILFSELFLYGRQPKIATVFTGIGIGGLYLVTMINYLSLKILPVGLAIGIAAVVGIVAVLLGQKREGAAIRIINIIGLYICMTPFLFEEGMEPFIAIAAVVGIVNLASLFISAENGRTAAELIQIIFAGCYTLIMGVITSVVNDFSSGIMEVYTLCCLVLMAGIFLKMKKKPAQLWVWGVFTVILSFGTTDGSDAWWNWLFLGIIVIFFAGACWMARNMEYKEVLYGVLSIALLIDVQSKLPEEVDGIVLMGMLLGLAAVFLLVSQLQVERKNIIAWVVLGMDGIYSLELPGSMWYGLDSLYASLKIEYWICMLIGAATILFLMQDKFGIRKKWRGITLAGYLTYMILLAGMEQELLTSVLLMVVALLAIAGGFLQEQKAARIYGLCLSLVVCVKMVIWDFWGESSLHRMLAFLIVGVLALVISLVYILLEKRDKN